jgi:hypothetical protein
MKPVSKGYSKSVTEYQENFRSVLQGEVPHTGSNEMSISM